MASLDYGKVQEFWEKAEPSSLSPYMMNGFGFPDSSAKYRFKAELKTMKRLLEKANCNGTVLDLGSGVGLWTSFFAENFSRVIAVESSLSLYQALVARCSSYSNIQIFDEDIRLFEPKTPISLIFSGGLLMYLNENDVRNLLNRLRGNLEPDGIIICRETTVRNGTTIRQGNYQAAYRSVSVYNEIFQETGFQVLKIEKNTPYVLMEMGIQFLENWKKLIPNPVQMISILGPSVYYSLRLLSPLLFGMQKIVKIEYPKLENHFFVLKPI